MYAQEDKKPQSVEDYIDTATDCYELITKWRNEDGWKTVKQTQPNVELKEKYVEGYDIPMLKVEGVLPASVQEVFEFSEKSPITIRQKWDALLESIEVLKPITNNIDVIYSIYKGFFPISKRDVTAIRCHKSLPNGGQVIYGLNIVYSQKPPVSAYVRAKGISGTFYLPVPGEPLKCKLVKMVLINPMGSIPLWAINLGKTKIAASLTMMSQLLTEKYGSNRIPVPTLHRYIQTEDVSETDSAEDDSVFFDTHEYHEGFEETNTPHPLITHYTTQTHTRTHTPRITPDDTSSLTEQDTMTQLEINKHLQNLLQQLKNNNEILEKRLEELEKMQKMTYFFKYLYSWKGLLFLFGVVCLYGGPVLVFIVHRVLRRRTAY